MSAVTFSQAMKFASEVGDRFVDVVYGVLKRIDFGRNDMLSSLDSLFRISSVLDFDAWDTISSTAVFEEEHASMADATWSLD